MGHEEEGEACGRRSFACVSTQKGISKEALQTSYHACDLIDVAKVWNPSTILTNNARHTTSQEQALQMFHVPVGELDDKFNPYRPAQLDILSHG